MITRGEPADVLTAGRLSEVFGVTLNAPTLPAHPWQLAAE